MLATVPSCPLAQARSPCVRTAEWRGWRVLDWCVDEVGERADGRACTEHVRGARPRHARLGEDAPISATDPLDDTRRRGERRVPSCWHGLLADCWAGPLEDLPHHMIATLRRSAGFASHARAACVGLARFTTWMPMAQMIAPDDSSTDGGSLIALAVKRSRFVVRVLLLWPGPVCQAAMVVFAPLDVCARVLRSCVAVSLLVEAHVRVRGASGVDLRLGPAVAQEHETHRDLLARCSLKSCVGGARVGCVSPGHAAAPLSPCVCLSHACGMGFPSLCHHLCRLCSPCRV